jgi:Rhomboid family
MQLLIVLVPVDEQILELSSYSSAMATRALFARALGKALSSVMVMERFGARCTFRRPKIQRGVKDLPAEKATMVAYTYMGLLSRKRWNDPSLKLCCAIGMLLALRLVQSLPIHALVVSPQATVNQPPPSQPLRSWLRRCPPSDGSSAVRRRLLLLEGIDSGKFLDFDTVTKDPRARVFPEKWKKLEPNEYSVTSRLIFFTVAAFCLQVCKPSVKSMGMKISDRILRGEELYRTFTPIFLHGGIAHLMVNMMSLKSIGGSVEQLFGPGRYLATYFASGVAGNIVSAFMSPKPSVGA